YFGNAIMVGEQRDTVGALAESMHGHAGAWAMISHAPFSLPFWLALGGILLAWLFYIAAPSLPGKFASVLALLHTVLIKKYGIDELYQAVFAGGGRALGRLLWRVGDVAIIDGFFVNGSARVVGWCATLARNLQTGFIYHYAFAMILGLLVLMSWFVWF
ncbi:MAG: NADH-quinone oxidoreductase subunit L, partial [Proteobacteria bacterium]